MPCEDPPKTITFPLGRIIGRRNFLALFNDAPVRRTGAVDVPWLKSSISTTLVAAVLPVD